MKGVAAVSRMVVAVCMATVLAACDGAADRPSASGTASVDHSASPAGDCPTLGVGDVAASSVLVPGPSEGVPATDATGERLVIVGAVLDAECRPAAGASVTVWHTDATGEYGPSDGTDPADIECCYYRGTVHTDQAGRFRLDTIRPGQYNQQVAPPAHVHVEISHPSGGLMTEIVFADDPDLPASAGSDGTVPVALSLIGDADGESWYGELTLVLEP